VYSEQYINSIAVEARLVIDMARTVIYPTALKYAADLATTYSVANEVGVSFDTTQVKVIAENANLLLSTVTELESALAQHDFADTKAHMEHSATSVRSLMETARSYADALEAQVDDAVWPLPKYREMLFIK
jgi:glutamine synthetase